LTGQKAPTSELIALALCHANCRQAREEGDCWTSLETGFLIPVDDVLDLIWAAVDRMVVYRIDKPTPEVISIAEDLQMTTDILKKVLRELRSKEYSHVQEHCIEINRLENRIDRKYRDALGKLVNDGNDAVHIIKWKDIYQLFEDASDRAEDVANILEGIVLKHA